MQNRYNSILSNATSMNSIPRCIDIAGILPNTIYIYYTTLTLSNHYVGVKRSGSLLALLGYLDSWYTGEPVVSDKIENVVSLSVSDVFCISATSCDITRPSVRPLLIFSELLLDVVGLVVPCQSWSTCLFQIWLSILILYDIFPAVPTIIPGSHFGAPLKFYTSICSLTSKVCILVCLS